jgi:hypothetical protein
MEHGVVVTGTPIIENLGRCEDNVYVPHVVVVVRELAYRRDSYLVCITLSRVQSICYGAFSGCPNLRHVDLGTVCISIADRSFAHCGRLVHVKTPSTLRHVGANAFAYCVSMRVFVTDAPLTHVGSGAFGGCVQLGRVSFVNATADAFEDGVFFGCTALTEAALPNLMRYLPEHTFERCYALRAICLPSCCNVIEHAAFSDCRRLRVVLVSAADAVVKAGAFQHCVQLDQLAMAHKTRVHYWKRQTGRRLFNAGDVRLTPPTLSGAFALHHSHNSMAACLMWGYYAAAPRGRGVLRSADRLATLRACVFYTTVSKMSQLPAEMWMTIATFVPHSRFMVV